MPSFELRSEFTAFAQAALKGDAGLASLIVAGRNASDLTWSVAPGPVPIEVGGYKYHPRAPFERQHMVDLIGGMMRKRWARYDDFLLTLEAPGDDLHDVIKAKWSDKRLFPGVGPGWLDLVDAALELAEAANVGEWVISDCKEKFGTLRLYSTAPGEAAAYIDAAEHLSGMICDVCGGLGKLRPGGWYVTRCDEHTGGSDGAR